MVTHEGLPGVLAEVIATMIQALRMGEPTRARQLGLTALAVYAHNRDTSVEQLLADADPLGEGAAIKDDVVVPEDALQVLDPPHSPTGGFMRAARVLAGLS